jgi:hypothetical protein
MNKIRKKKLVIWVCEDDEALWDFQGESLKEHFPEARIRFFVNAGFAARAIGSPNYILIDVGGICNLGNDFISATRYNVEGLSKLHPGAIFIINSAVGAYAKVVYNELKSECQVVSMWVDGCNMDEDICNVIKKYETNKS